jgi:hypothetical protein
MWTAEDIRNSAGAFFVCGDCVVISRIDASLASQFRGVSIRGFLFSVGRRFV